MSDKQNKGKNLPENIDIILPAIEPLTRVFSVRAKHAFYRLVESCNNSLKEWYELVSSSDFNASRVRNIGAGTAEELNNLIVLIKGYLESFTDDAKVAEAVERFNSSEEFIEPKKWTKNKRHKAIEEIIRNAKRPLSLDKLYKEFCKQCPDEKIKQSTFRAVLSECVNVLPVGRSSKYTLREWKEGTARGGTTRDIVYDYLSSLDLTIAPLDKVAKVVRKHRPKTTSSTLVSNIKNDKSGQFCVYYFKGERYLGLKNTYPEDYFPWTSDAKSAETMSINYPRLKKFITTKKHFPFSSEPGEEGELGSFWEHQTVLYGKKKLDAHARKYHKSILTDYGFAQISKENFEWSQMVKDMTAAIKSGRIESIGDKIWIWFAKCMIKHTRGELNDKQQKDLLRLLQIIQNYK